MPTLANPLFIRKIEGNAACVVGRPGLEQGHPLSTPSKNSPAPTGEPPRSIPLNAFQRVLRGWEEVHPYNAAQVLELRREVRLAEATAAWAATLEEMQLGRVEVKPISYRHISLNGEMAQYPARSVPAETRLETFIADELNRPFADPNEPPFRPFVQHDASAGTWHFGVVYQHWVADSVAVRHMLRRWLERMFLPPQHHRRFRIRHANIGYLGLLELAPGAIAPAQTLLSMVRRHLRYRRARKCRTHGKDDYPVRVFMADAPGIIPKLIDSSRKLGGKVNDLFLAAAARACDKRIPTQHRANRPDLAIGSIVDLRPLAKGKLDDRFGLFLGFAEVVCRPDEIASRPKLLASIARQNRLHRQRGVWPSSVGYLLAAMASKPLVKAQKLYHFFRKETPLIAGVSNVNLSHSWAAEQSDLIVRYRRISPSGPLAPVVFAVTALGNDLHMSMTYRASLLTPTEATELGNAFLQELMLFAD